MQQRLFLLSRQKLLELAKNFEEAWNNNDASAGNALRVDPAGEKDVYKITFSELGWPPAYSGQTSLAIRPQDRRVLRLPAIDFGQSAMLETVMLIQYKIRDQDDGEKSRFEIN